jgi:hypothetical protein
MVSRIKHRENLKLVQIYAFSFMSAALGATKFCHGGNVLIGVLLDL